METRYELLYELEEEQASVTISSAYNQAQDSQADFEEMLKTNIVDLDWLMADVDADLGFCSDLTTLDSQASIPPAVVPHVSQEKMYRAQAILRYRMKKTKKYGSSITKRQKTKYAARSALAQRRPRVHGRFI